MPSIRITITALSVATVLTGAVMAQTKPVGPATGTAPASRAATLPATRAAASAPVAVKYPTTMDEVQAAMDRGEYSNAVIGIGRIVAPGHPLDYDKHAMLMLRAECELQLKQTTQALQTLDSIRKKAHEDASNLDESEAAALAFLIHKSPQLTYIPKTAASKIPISILDRTRRKEVYLDLYTDELAVVQQTTRDAAFGKTLVPISTVCDTLYNVQAAERVATGDIVNTKKVAVQLVESARIIIASIETAYDGELVQISNSANQVVTVRTGVRGGRVQTADRALGLSPQQAHRVSDILADCNLIMDLILRLRILSDNPEALPVLFDRAGALKGNAQIVAAGGVVTSLGAIPADNAPARGGARRGGRAGRGG